MSKLDLFGAFTRSGGVTPEQRQSAIDSETEKAERKRLREQKRREEAQERQRQREEDRLDLDISDTENGSSGSDNDSGSSSEEENMADFEKEDKRDAADAQSKTANFKLPWNDNLPFWFSQFESHLENAGINSQWSKRIVLHKQLDSKKQDDCEDLLIKKKSEAGETPYYDLKKRILDLYGPQIEDAYDKACGMFLTDKPSQLAKRLISTLCPKHPDLKDCCVEGVISRMWRKQLPTHVKAAVAGLRLGDGQLDTTLRLADAVYASLAPPTATAAAVAAVTPKPQTTAPAQPAQPTPATTNDLETSADTPALDVAAAFRGARQQRGRGTYRPQARGQPRGRGQYQQFGQPRPAQYRYQFQTPYQTASRNQQYQQPYQPQTANTGPRHADEPPPNACQIHWTYGRSARSCRAPLTCPWKHVIAPQRTY